jgi:hypothetical protein
MDKMEYSVRGFREVRLHVRFISWSLAYSLRQVLCWITETSLVGMGRHSQYLERYTRLDQSMQEGQKWSHGKEDIISRKYTKEVQLQVAYKTVQSSRLLITRLPY